MTHYDICVFGAGPSGSVIAKRLAQMGHSVVLVEKEKFPRNNIGLSLTPGIHHWLDLLELKDEVNEAGFTRALESFILWESDETVKKEFKPELAGYHVNRGQFDEILLQSALADGVDLLQPCTLNRLDQNESGNWKISLTHYASKKLLSAKFIVEATGRKSILKGIKRAYLPKTTATYAYWKTNSKNHFSFIEAGKNEWYWGTPVNNGYLACVFSDPKVIKKYDTIQGFYFDKINSSSLFAKVKDKRAGEILICPATAYTDEIPVANNYIKVGDAAFSMDPLSSQGVQKAFKSAYQGAVVVNTLLKKETPNAALDYYNTLIESEVVKNTKWTKQFYNRQQRFDGGDFWNRRKDKTITDFEKVNEIQISVKKEDTLFINSNVTITKVPTVGENLIAYREGIVLEGNEEPLVFLQNIHIPSLVADINGKPLLEGLKIIQFNIPQSNPMKILRWLIYHSVLSTKNFHEKQTKHVV